MVIKIILIIIAVYAVFFAGPAVASFFKVYGVKRGTPYRERRGVENSYYAPYLKRMDAACAELDSLPHERVTMIAPDGAPLCAEYFDAESDRTAILLHGYNALPYNNFALVGRDLRGRGFNVMMIYARAHLPSGGKHAALGALEQYDLLGWIAKARESGADKILIYGMSMGAATAAYAADKIDDPAVKALIIDSAYASPYGQYVYDCKRRFIPWFMLAPIHRLLGRAVLGCDLKRSVRDSLKNNRLPVLFIHGTDDETVPFAVGKKNFAACVGDKRCLWVKGAHHTMGYAEAGDKVWDFIDEKI